MKCPKCKKSEIVQNISYKRAGWSVPVKIDKTYTFFCPLCDFHKEKIIQISEQDQQAELKARSLGRSEKTANVEAEFGGFKLRSSGKEK